MMGHIEIELESGRAISVHVGIIDYLIQDEHPQWWLSALASEVSESNVALIAQLKEDGLVSGNLNRWGVIREMRELPPESVRPLRDAFIKEYTYEHNSHNNMEQIS
jgi:hypothetical protein